MLLFAAGFGIERLAVGSSSSTGSGGASPTTSTSLPADPDAAALRQLVVQQSDVGSNLAVALLQGGDQVRGTATLDLCNGKFASEPLRTARLQDAVVDMQGMGLLSTEAVLYRNADATAQAFNELRTVAANCPNSPVVSPVGEPTVTTHFDAAPDGDWPQTPGVDRLAYSFTATGQSGQAQPSMAVYLRRGRALLGIYFVQPQNALPAIDGQTTAAGIVGVFASRLAQQPASVVNGQ